MTEWCRVMEAATGLSLPWRMLRDKLVTLDLETQKVRYSTTFDKINDSDINVSVGPTSVRFGEFMGRICNPHPLSLAKCLIAGRVYRDVG